MPERPLPAPKGLTKVWRLGGSLQVNGELSAGVDVSIDGVFDGKVVLPERQLSTGAASRIWADVDAKNVLVRGYMVGNITAQDSVTVARTATVRGQIRARRVILADGCKFDGRICKTGPAH